MSADRVIDRTRGFQRAVEGYGRDVDLNQGTTVAQHGGMVVQLQQFMSGYDGSETTLPFTSDVSVEGGSDIVVG